MTILPGHHELGWSQAVVVAAWMFAQRLMCASTEELEQTLAQAVVDALHSAHLTTKDAASAMQIDEAQLRRQLRGEKHMHISLTRLVKLPYTFWLHFAPVLMFLVAKKRMTEIAEDLHLRKPA